MMHTPYSCPVCYQQVLEYPNHDGGKYDRNNFNDQVLHDYHILRDKVDELEKRVEELIAKYVEPFKFNPEKDDRFDNIDL
jgi:hypothetical protein